MRACPFAAHSIEHWPDLDSPVLSKIDFDVPLIELCKWLEIRDTFLGLNEREQDVTKALGLARDCKHPDALWLSSVCERSSTKEEARAVLLCEETDARALCFSWFLSDDRVNDLGPLRFAAAKGNAFACSTLCGEVWEENEKEALRLALYAVSLKEREGYYWLGFLFKFGPEIDRDLILAKENFLIAAELGDVYAASEYGTLFPETDPARWFWLTRAALHGLPDSLLYSFSRQVELFFSGSGNAKIVFLIGRALKGNVNVDRKEIFGIQFGFGSWIRLANQAALFHESQARSARLAVDTWALVAMRLHLIKDLRIFIGKMIWEARFEANYMIENDPFSCSE